MSNKKVINVRAMGLCQHCWVWGKWGSKWENNSQAVPKPYKNQVAGMDPAPGPYNEHKKVGWWLQ